MQVKYYSCCVVFALHSYAMAGVGFKNVDLQITSSLVDPISVHTRSPRAVTRGTTTAHKFPVVSLHNILSLQYEASLGSDRMLPPPLVPFVWRL